MRRKFDASSCTFFAAHQTWLTINTIDDGSQKYSQPIKPYSFGHVHARFLCQMVLHFIRYKKLVQVSITLTQETCTKLWYKILELLPTRLSWLSAQIWNDLPADVMYVESSTFRQPLKTQLCLKSFPGYFLDIS